MEENVEKPKAKYLEGECENCGEYARLYDVNGIMLCEDCRDEEGAISKDESETEE